MKNEFINLLVEEPNYHQFSLLSFRDLVTDQHHLASKNN